MINQKLIPPKPELAPIQDGVTYPLDDFQRRTGLGRHAMRVARAKGLAVLRIGKRAFVRGEDFNRFLAAQQPAGAK